MEEKLIAAIQEHPCLFDKSSVTFRNRYLKDTAWQAVAAAVQVSEEQCKTRWKSLRDRFVRENSLNKMKSGAAADERRPWCYMESMRFLTKHIAPKRTCSNLEFFTEESLTSQAPLTPLTDIIVEEVEEEYLEGSQSTWEEGPSSSRSAKRQRIGNESRERFDRLCGTIEAVLATKSKEVPSKNAAFLQMLDECIQKKPEEVQDKLKIDLLAYVHNY